MEKIKNISKLKPLGIKLAIHPIEDPSQTPSGLIHIPDSAKQRTDQGIIIAIGSEVTESLSIGDHVFFNSYSGDKIVLEDDNTIIYVIPETHIIGVYNDSGVSLFDSATLVRLIQERSGELVLKCGNDRQAIVATEKALQDIIDRIETFAQAEGLEF